MKPEEINLADPDLYAVGDPESAWSVLRSNIPVFWNRPVDHRGFWALTRYDHAVRVYRDTKSFTSERGMMLGVDPAVGDPAAGKMLVVTDPPRHAKLRQVIGGAFTPTMVRRLEAGMRSTAAELLQRALAAGSCDFVTDIAAWLPVSVICDMMGVPREDWGLMHSLTSAAFGADDPETQHLDVRAEKAEAHGNILLYYSELVAERRRRPQDDIVSALTRGLVDGRPLSDEEILLNCDNLIIGGNETTRHAAAGGLLALIEHPTEWERLRTSAPPIQSAVEEILRWTTPVMHVLRTAVEDVWIDGQLIRAGEVVTIWNSSANRDPEVFRSPQSFDVGRWPNRHLTFGLGEHFCLGASLARLELGVLLETMAGSISRMELTGPVERLRSNFIRGITHLPVSLEGQVLGAVVDT